MKHFSLVFIFLNVILMQGQNVVRRKTMMLGSPFEMTVVANDSLQGNLYIDQAIAEVKRIENLISDWIPTTQISTVNQKA
jgi:thiamine biosynthesis lipoprotein